MNGRSSQQTVSWMTSGILLVLLAVGVVWTLSLVKEQHDDLERVKKFAYVPNGKYLGIISLGYDQLVSDLIWLKVVQHLGNPNESREGMLWAFHAVNAVTDIDPKFVWAYQITGTILTVFAGMAEESITILQKGMKHNPDRWELPYLAGYTYFFERCDPKNSAHYLQIASKIEGSPSYLPKLAARMSVEAGDVDSALLFLQSVRQEMKDPVLLESIDGRLKEVVVEKDILFLEKGILLYHQHYGKMPTQLQDLVTGNIIGEIPPEPFGGTYVMNKLDGDVASTTQSTRLRVYSKRKCR